MTAAIKYRPPHRKQKGTGPCEWENCNCASHSMIVDVDWLHAKTLGVRAIREFISNRYVHGCVGTSMTMNRIAVEELAGTDLTYRWDVDPDRFFDALDAGRWAVALEDYTGWHGTPWDESPNFNGFHAVLYGPFRRYNDNLSTPRWERLRFDPLADGPAWVPESRVRLTMTDALSNFNVEFQFSRGLRAMAPKKVLYGQDSRGKKPGVRSAPGGGTRLMTLKRGTMVRHTGFTKGHETNINGRPDKKWLRVVAIGDRAVSQIWPGRTAVYMARGWFRGPTGAV